MKRGLILMFISVMFIGCNHEINPEDLAKINGYWEIENVILPNGVKKEFSISETIDYFEIHDNIGYRQKVKPQVDGKYVLDTKSEKVEVIREGDKTFLKYATNYTEWKEQILEITDKTLVVKNANNLEYHYKKPIPFTIK